MSRLGWTFDPRSSVPLPWTDDHHARAACRGVPRDVVAWQE
ncbi:hypothetical protein YT1_4147 [Rhodococcus ruber]|nr:hypothetical protein YT1_4147 [Rhodococcus ruber]